MRYSACFLLILFSFMTVGFAQRSSGSMPDDAEQQFQKLTQFYIYLNGYYIDEVDDEKVVESAIRGMLAELDPHSSYITKAEMASFSESVQGKFSGIGVEINTLNDTLRVMGVIGGGPSEKVGVIPNDRIIAVDGKSIVGMLQSDVVKMLRGPKNTEVNIEVVRLGESGTLHFRIIRDDISIKTIDAAYMPAPSVGYIRVNRFARTTMSELREAFKTFENPGSLILDLRNNGGGILPQAVEMANFFLPRGSVIVSTEGRMSSEQHKASRDGQYIKGRVVVLIDDFSASASEIVAGALQDWDRAVIVGRRSFGKGLVQRQFPLTDGSAVNITISRYLTPTGRAIQRPFVKGKEEDYYHDFSERLAADYVDTLQKVDSLKYKTLRLGKTVYGGGGIYPDYYVPSDTAGYTPYMLALIRKGVIYEFSNSYLDANRAALLEKYSEPERFRVSFSVTDDMFDQLVELGEKREVPLNQEQLETSREEIAQRIRIYVARSLWGYTESYRIANEGDPVMEKALEVLSDWDNMADGIATGHI